ncbi:heavy-metal-associated domain-containing protein [bacterium]|nr:MAG: heavy-metal-associated domain-containing protein [bacterium]
MMNSIIIKRTVVLYFFILIFASVHSQMDSIKQPDAKGSVQELIVKIKGMVCPFCSYSLEKALEALPYIQKVKNIDLQSGKVDLIIKGNTSKSLGEIEKSLDDTIKKATFSFDGIDTIFATGVVKKDDFGFFANVVGSKIYLNDTHKKGDTLSKEKESRMAHFVDESSVIEIIALIHKHPDGSFGVSDLKNMKPAVTE